jgi:hypothetical protein
MKTRIFLHLSIFILTALTLFTGTPPTSHASTLIFMDSPVVISQLYGGAEGINATFSDDYVELFNRGSEAMDVTGWSVQTLAEGSTEWRVTPLSGTIEPGRYYLVQQGGTLEESTLPAPDAYSPDSLRSTGGVVALVRDETLLTGSCPADTPTLADLVGYGDVDCAEVTAAVRMGAVEALHRRGNGCTESDNNANDFTVATPNPHNRTAPAETCRGPVILVSMSTHNEREYIEIRWETSLEQETRGFNIYRGTGTSQNPVRINEVEIAAYGGSGQINQYDFPDYAVETNVTYYYYLEDIDINGNRYLNAFAPILRENPSAVTLQGLNVTSATLPNGLLLLAGLSMTLAAGWVWRQRQ